MSTRSLTLTLAALVLAVTMLAAWMPVAPERPGAFVRATACLAPSDVSTVRVTWTIPAPGTEPIAAYAVGLTIAEAPLYSDTVAADSPRAVEVAVPCPEYGASVAVDASVRAIDALGLGGGTGRASLVLTTAQPVPPGTPEVTIDTVALGEPEAPGTLAIEVTGGARSVLAVCDGDVCDVSWMHDETMAGGEPPPAYAVWLVEGDPLSVELPVWPEGPDPVSVGGVVAYPVSQGACAYPVRPRGPAPQLHTCRVWGAPADGDVRWEVTWSRVEVEPIAPETLAVGLASVSDLRVVRVAPTALALAWTEVGDGRGGAADYGLRWQTGGEWSDAVAVLGSEVGETVGYTVVGLPPGSTVTIEVAPFRGLLPDRLVAGVPTTITVETAAARDIASALALR
ncbi:MAG: fibronectin type III domain-containing protein [Dehalococcoidia bacterium]|nr:fibronectin type III domain-containing protein [Dehalococcoidia bacterium]